MPNLEQIFLMIDGYRDEIIRLQSELTSRVALGPENEGTGEHEKTCFISDLLSESKPDILEEIKAPDKKVPVGYRPNLVAE